MDRRRPIEALAALPAARVAGISALFAGVVAVVDFRTGYQFGLSIFYLVPILWVSWALGRRPGLLFSLLCAALWLSVDLLSADRYTHPLAPYWNASARLTVFALAALAVTSLKNERAMARRDALTMLANRAAFFESAELELERGRRHGRPIALAYIDCDDFKAVNDRYGHATGDQLLKVVALVLRDNLRATDLVARLGGDEFVVLLPESPPETVGPLVEKLKECLDRAMLREGWPATFSIGVIACSTPPAGVETLIRKADALMYAVKHSGKNGFRFEIADSPSAVDVPRS